ncbi:MAG: hypothetical protein LBR16_00385 [Treponema sp.]|jgi:hypothetical protein|nr:hypothetical protein [Treponema sp.]
MLNLIGDKKVDPVTGKNTYIVHQQDGPSSDIIFVVDTDGKTTTYYDSNKADDYDYNE